MVWAAGPLMAPERGRTRVLLVADHGLVAESVRAALATLRYDITLVRWPSALVSPVRSRRRVPMSARPDVAVLISDLDRTDRVRVGQALIGGLDVPWLVLTGAVRGPAWGAMYERGAALVVPSSLGLTDFSVLIDSLAAGQLPPTAPRRRRPELIGAWRRLSRRRDEIASRLATLTEREDEILELLATGVQVRDIAERSGVAEATVRSQVKSILRKLGVGSQIAAVAIHHQHYVDDLESVDEPDEEPEPVADRTTSMG
jgi:two-component system, NarL family, nitrate/nitrite response regulator NarL